MKSVVIGKDVEVVCLDIVEHLGWGRIDPIDRVTMRDEPTGFATGLTSEREVGPP